MSEENRLYIKEMRPGIFLLDEDHEATGFLVIGEKKAALIDTMSGRVNLKAEVEKLTQKPLTVINTHGHPDHIYGNIYFEEAYIHPADLELADMFFHEPEFISFCEEKQGKVPPFNLLKEGDVFDLGGRHLQVYENPGHTKGQIVLLLPEERILFTGDSINHHLWMQLEGCCSMPQLVTNLDRIMFLEKEADVILHGHAHDFDDISLLRCLRNGAQEICDKKTGADRPYHYFGGEARQHPFACLPGKSYQQEDHVICYPCP